MMLVIGHLSLNEDILADVRARKSSLMTAESSDTVVLLIVQGPSTYRVCPAPEFITEILLPVWILTTIMVHFSVSSMFFHEYPIDEIFDFVAETGLDAIEFWPETPDFWVRGQPMQELHSCLRNHPELSCNTVHTPILDLNPCSINPGVAVLSLDHA